jgi:hypothetical protein
MGLPARLGGLGITDPSLKSSTFYENSKSITAPIVNIIIDQSRVSPPEIKKAQINEKNHTRNLRRRHEKAEANLIAERLPPNLQREKFLLRKEFQHGLPRFRCLTMGSTYTKELFKMPYV